MGFRLDAKKNPPHLKQGRVDATCAQITATPRFQLEGTSAKKSMRRQSGHAGKSTRLVLADLLHDFAEGPRIADSQIGQHLSIQSDLRFPEGANES